MATPSLPTLNAPSSVLPEIKTESLVPPQQEAMLPPAELVETETSQQQQHKEQQLQLLKSIDHLGTLSAAINTFKCRFGELQKHLDFIQNSIDSKFKDYRCQPTKEVDTQLAATPPPRSAKTEPPKETEPVNGASVKPWKSEIQYLCETMCSRGVRKFINGQLSDVSMLREEVPVALKLAPKPAKLVSECIGRFYLQGRKAYTKDSHMVTSRQAALLTLECFLLMLRDCKGGEIEIDPTLKGEMQQGAIAWKKRLISEGGLSRASEVDARGLLLFIACFGIPAAFKGEDIGNLLRLCNRRDVSDVLKGSSVLLAKLPDIMEGMVKNGLHVEAIDVACSFGVEDKFSPQSILTTVLRESKEAYKKAIRDARSSPVALKQANVKQLVVLKSVVKCAEDHSLDLAKLFGGWQIKEKIVKLEKEIADLDKQIEDKAAPKRKLDEMGSSSKVKTQEMKRSRFAVKEPPLLTSPHLNGFHEQRAATLANGMRSYGAMVPNHVIGGVSGHVYSYPAVHTAAGVGGSLMTNSYPAVHAAGAGLLSTSSYAAAHGEIGVDKVPQTLGKIGPPYGWHGTDAAIIDRSVVQSSREVPASVVAGGLYGLAPGFSGLPDYPSSGDPNQASASNLYRFADVVESESYGSGSHRPGATAPSAIPAYHPSYMY